MRKWLKRIFVIFVLVISVGLVIYGQKSIGGGVKNLVLMLLGVAGFLGLLFAYNKQYK